MVVIIQQVQRMAVLANDGEQRLRFIAGKIAPGRSVSDQARGWLSSRRRLSFTV
jgi:hypothetical protein